MLPDGETRFDHLGVCAAIDAAINNRRIVPVAVLGIDNINEHERTEILGGRSKLIKDIAGHLLPMIRAEQPASVGRPFAHSAGRAEPRRDQCANGARYAPETFGLVLSHSPSMWWTPERTSRRGLVQRNRYLMGE